MLRLIFILVIILGISVGIAYVYIREQDKAIKREKELKNLKEENEKLKNQKTI